MKKKNHHHPTNPTSEQMKGSPFAGDTRPLPCGKTTPHSQGPGKWGGGPDTKTKVRAPNLASDFQPLQQTSLSPGEKSF